MTVPPQKPIMPLLGLFSHTLLFAFTFIYLETIQDEVKELREKLAKAKRENEELKGELNCFDPAFFDEIEDLKYNHNEMVDACAYMHVVHAHAPNSGLL